jgi:hypothetical protein
MRSHWLGAVIGLGAVAVALAVWWWRFRDSRRVRQDPGFLLLPWSVTYGGPPATLGGRQFVPRPAEEGAAWVATTPAEAYRMLTALVQAHDRRLVFELVANLHDIGLRFRRDRDTYTPDSGILRWRAVDPGRAAITVERWTHAAEPDREWRFTADGPAGRFTLASGRGTAVTVGRVIRWLKAVEILPGAGALAVSENTIRAELAAFPAWTVDECLTWTRREEARGHGFTTGHAAVRHWLDTLGR